MLNLYRYTFKLESFKNLNDVTNEYEYTLSHI